MDVMIVGANAKAFKYVNNALNTIMHDSKIYALSKDECDVTNLEKLLLVHKQINPDLIINLSAYTNTYAPDTDKSEYAKCYKINAIGPKNIALVSRKPIIHISTNYVYKNGKDLYKESDVGFIGPETAYGMHKWIGEEYLRRLSVRHFILRTQWLFDKSEENFLSKLIAGRLQNQGLDDLSYGIPTSYKTLGRLIALTANAIKSDTIKAGIYAAVNSGDRITTWQLAQRIGQGNLHRKQNSDRIISIPLDNSKIKLALQTDIEEYTKAINE